jgi:hypothetical protein
MILLSGHDLTFQSDHPFESAHRQVGYGSTNCPRTKLADTHRGADHERALGAHVDTVILVLTPQVCVDTSGLIRECLAKLGD